MGFPERYKVVGEDGRVKAKGLTMTEAAEAAVSGDHTERMDPPECELTGRDGNIFFVIGSASHALRRAGFKHADIQAFQAEVRESDSYDAALVTVMGWMEAR